VYMSACTSYLFFVFNVVLYVKISETSVLLLLDISRDIWNFSRCFKIFIFYSTISCGAPNVLRNCSLPQNSGWETQCHTVGNCGLSGLYAL